MAMQESLRSVRLKLILYSASLVMVMLTAGPARAQFSLSTPGPVSFAPLVKHVAAEVVGITVAEAGGSAPANPVPEIRKDSPKASKPLMPVAEAAGSGFIVRRDGLIVTNNHVIEGAASITVTLNDGEHFSAQVVGVDQLTDLALIKIDAPRPLAAIRWGDSANLQVGDWILAAGNPFALGNSFTAGIISAEGRDIGDGPFDHFLQIDAPINPGNSGGPAFNMRGEVVGVNTAIVSPSGGSVGIGFAIPSNTAAKIVAELISGHGDIARGWLGVSVADMPDNGGNPAPGAVVTGVEPDGPAFKAGLISNDIILSVNSAQIANSNDLIGAIASISPGSKVNLGIRRNGHILTLPVVVDRRPTQLGE